MHVCLFCVEGSVTRASTHVHHMCAQLHVYSRGPIVASCVVTHSGLSVCGASVPVASLCFVGPFCAAVVAAMAEFDCLLARVSCLDADDEFFSADLTCAAAPHVMLEAIGATVRSCTTSSSPPPFLLSSALVSRPSLTHFNDSRSEAE